MARLIVAAIGVLLFASGAGAQDGGIWGDGHTKCSIWSYASEHDHPVAMALTEWVGGFISASKLMPPGKPLSDNDTDTVIYDWLKTYCAAHRDVLLPDAAKAFAAEHRK